jgi:hypothetical protein
MRAIPWILGAVVLAGCAKPAPLGPQPSAFLGPQLSAPDIRDVMVGNTGRGQRTGTNSQFEMYVAPDGTLVSKSLVGVETGSWRISDDGRFCSTAALAVPSGEVCQTVHKAGIGVQLASPTSVEEMVFVPGKAI